jgi:hypothetical protein
MVPRLDLTDLAAAMARPGNDPREWVSYGTVVGSADPESDGACVFFDREQPYVRVRLEPSLVECNCRVGGSFAGDGEAEWSPFVPGDELLIALPEGTPRAGGVVLARLSNEIDKFPSGSVAGQDPRKNAFAFRRRKAPVVEEHNGPVLLRNALTASFVSLDDAGVLTLRAGNPADPDAKQPAPGLQMGPDGVSMQDATAKYALSLGPTSGAFLVLAGDAVLSLSSSQGGKPSMMAVPGALALGAAGNPPLEHAISTEAVVGLVQAILTDVATAFALIPPTVGGAPGGAPYAAAIAALVASGFSTSIAAAGALNPAALAAITAKFASSGPKPNTPSGQLAPGIGSPGILIG